MIKNIKCKRLKERLINEKGTSVLGLGWPLNVTGLLKIHKSGWINKRKIYLEKLSLLLKLKQKGKMWNRTFKCKKSKLNQAIDEEKYKIVDKHSRQHLALIT